MKNIFEYCRGSQFTLSEAFEKSEFYFLITDGEKTRKISLYSLSEAEKEEKNLYLGHTGEEVLASGKDILGIALTQNGDPEYDEVKRVLPELSVGAYAFLGGPASWSGLTVEADGRAVHQLSGRNREPSAVFDPTSIDPSLGAITPRRMLVGGEYPLLISLHTDGVNSLELLYFVEPGDTDRDPILWIRIKKYKNSSPEVCELEYKVAAISREGDESLFEKAPLNKDVYLDALCETLSFWLEYSHSGAEMNLPIDDLSRCARGAMSFAALTFTGDHPHYGHKFYGKELHDNFPPNYLWAIEAAVLQGRALWAKEIFSHLLRYAVSFDGRICYRQGEGLNFGVSATEYGMLLHLANKYKTQLGIEKASGVTAKKICGMGEQILAHCLPCAEFGGMTLVKMCAEADTNERVNVYLNNNLWAIRGFDALVNLFYGSDISTEKFSKMRDELKTNIDSLIEKYSVKDSRFGILAPFRFGYTPTPLTLSNCAETFRPLTEEENEFYFSTLRTRGKEKHEQDITENTYANYRYYPEALSSMLLSKELADGMINLRENLGGEIMGMTRFRSWIDNWPVIHYARFLIESGRIEKFLLLLYSHISHHGRLDLMAYYEQIRIDGSVKAHDCIPSLLTAPIMLSWIFAYETVEGTRLRLLSALPKKWYSEPFNVSGLGYSDGRIDFVSDGESMEISFDRPTLSECELVWRAKSSLTLEDFESGLDFVKEIRENTIILKKGIKAIKIKIKGEKT